MDSLSTSLRYRYPGVKPFTTDEQELFFGRENDIASLFSLIFVKQIVVLYSKSGYGKSSLINAGIIPKLQRETNFVYFPIRLNNYSEREESDTISPTETVRRRLNNLTSGTPSTSPLDALITQENSFWYWLKTYQWQRQQTHFILFFDQFEELFTYPKAQIDEFSAQLAQLLYPTISVAFDQRMMELEAVDELTDELHDFLYQKPEIKVVFSVRSDRLSLLNSLTDQHPAILQYCYELDALNRSQAIRAITEPAQVQQQAGYISPAFSYQPDAVVAILDNIANPQDGKIELATLQIVCRYIEDELIAQQPHVVISPKQLGNITDIFQQYYEGILNRLSDSDRMNAQQLIEDQLIDNGRRNPLTETYILNKFGIGADLLIQLEKTSLLRKERDANGRLLYEVGHDTLVEAIERVATSRRAEETKIRQKALEQAVENERARAEQLQALTRQAILRSRVAIAFAIMAVLIAGLALYYKNDAQRATRQAQQEEQKAAKNALYLSMALDQVNWQKIVALQETGQRYEEYDEYGLALDAYKAADSLLRNIQQKSVATQNTASAKAIPTNELQALKYKLVSRIDSCRRKL